MLRLARPAVRRPRLHPAVVGPRPVVLAPPRPAVDPAVRVDGAGRRRLGPEGERQVVQAGGGGVGALFARRPLRQALRTEPGRGGAALHPGVPAQIPPGDGARGGPRGRCLGRDQLGAAAGVGQPFRENRRRGGPGRDRARRREQYRTGHQRSAHATDARASGGAAPAVCSGQLNSLLHLRSRPAWPAAGAAAPAARRYSSRRAPSSRSRH